MGPDGDVDALMDEVDDTVVDLDIDLNVRKAAPVRHHEISKRLAPREIGGSNNESTARDVRARLQSSSGMADLAHRPGRETVQQASVVGEGE